MSKYTIMDLQRQFPDDEACLAWLKDSLYPEGITCNKCKKVTPHHKIRGRKVYSCERCGTHVSPTANTIFHKSRTPLTLWFYAVFLMASTRAGISAKQLERELGVTYKTAWRMFHQIRSMMGDDTGKIEGDAEIDETYLGPIPNRRTSAKARSGEMIFGAVERGGRAKVKHVKTVGVALIPEVKKAIHEDAQIHSDSYNAYKKLYWLGFKHKMVNHYSQEWVRGEVHTNNIENLWSNMKRGIKGVYRHVDPKYLQAYADEYAFRYSHRFDTQPMFWALMNRVVK